MKELSPIAARIIYIVAGFFAFISDALGYEFDKAQFMSAATFLVGFAIDLWLLIRSKVLNLQVQLEDKKLRLTIETRLLEQERAFRAEQELKGKK